MQKKQYVLITTQEQPEITMDFEVSAKNAVLLTLLDCKIITQWQYEQCISMLQKEPG